MWLRIESHGEKAILEWGNVWPHRDKYDIELGRLRGAAAKVRAQLAELAMPVVDVDPERRLKCLRALAAAGHSLRNALFSSPGNSTIAAQLDKWVTQQRVGPEAKFFIAFDSTIHVPWGLVYDGPPEEIQELQDSPEAFKDFWCMKYALSSTVGGYSMSEESLTRQADRCRLLSLVNRHVEQEVRDHGDADVVAKFDRLLKRAPIGTAYTGKAIKDLVKTAGAGDTVFHFFGHHHDSVLDLGNEETLDVDGLESLLKVISDAGGEQCYGLVIVNGCGSASGGTYTSLLPACNLPRHCGLIGAEAIVPSTFAATFSDRLIDSLFSAGHSVGEAMLKLHRDDDLWPRSLLYGCYAQPDYRIAKAA